MLINQPKNLAGQQLYFCVALFIRDSFSVDEMSAEEEELLGIDFCKSNEDDGCARPVEHDDVLAKTLDKLILYLRYSTVF